VRHAQKEHEIVPRTTLSDVKMHDADGSFSKGAFGMENSGVFRARLEALPQHLSPIIVTALILTAIAALLATGYWTDLGSFQSLPLYAYLIALLVLLQLQAVGMQDLPNRIFLLLSSLIAIIYIGIITYGPQIPIISNPWTYIVLNLVLLAVFIWDAVARMREKLKEPLTDGKLNASDMTGNVKTRLRIIQIVGAIAADGVALAIVLAVVIQG
jgi:hypothetical protein